MKNHLIIILLSFLLFFGCRPKEPIVEFRNNHPVELALAFYPSTLRMLNLANNENYNHLIKDIEKGRYFRLNKEEDADDTRQAIRTLTQTLKDEGYEEVMTVQRNGEDITVLVMDSQTPVIVTIVETKEDYSIIELKGMINVTQVPKLLNSFNDDSFLNIFSLYAPNKPKQKVEPDTANRASE